MPAEQPEIVIARSQRKSLKRLIAEAFRLRHRIAPFLSAEVRRASICDDSALPGDVVAPGRDISYRLDWDKATPYRTLVYPEHYADGEKQISILSPIGAALLGLRAGGRIRVFLPGTGFHHLYVAGVK
ncbi:MAG TPA: GreA/GreB family elongation factor [Rhizomicrobium sp.]|jgi:regulator of nucleoside diphosphate kinase